jgi:hypothetical protein
MERIEAARSEEGHAAGSRTAGRAARAAGLLALALAVLMACNAAAQEVDAVDLPQGVRAVWDIGNAYSESTPTRERVCINGLWRWQPAEPTAQDVPAGSWGYFKVPGCWPGITSYMQKDSQTVHAHPEWSGRRLGDLSAAWYERRISVPAGWAGRRIALSLEYLNSFAAVYVDGRRVGEVHFPAGEVDLTAACRPGGDHVLSMLVVAMPLKGVMLSYSDSASAREVRGSVARRGLCGDVYLVGEPAGPRIADVRVRTSVREWRVAFDAALEELEPGARYALRAELFHGDVAGPMLTRVPFGPEDTEAGRMALTMDWHPPKLWDTHTPGNTCRVRLSLLDDDGAVLDQALPVRFGFREFWIEGRDFYLNGTRIHLSAVPLDNAQVGAALANYEAARESMERLQSFGVNFVFTHNYGCQPGAHLGFEEVLRAADDVGMLVALSQPHFGHYEWDAPDADRTNGYARHAAFYARVAGSHPSVVAYSTSHNACGYAEDMNPDMIDGVQAARGPWAQNNVRRALRAEAIVKALDPGRIVYHHASGNLGSMHLSNFYANFVPAQEMSDWFEHWATEGVKPLFLCEYGVPFAWDWTMYRGWYDGRRAFGSARVPWEFCLAEWNAQFLGDEAFRISDREKENLRWEAAQLRAGRLWHRWDYPTVVGSGAFTERGPIYHDYFTDNWRAHRTWGVSGFGPWGYGQFWQLRDGVDKGRRELATDWENLQRPGFSPDYIEGRYERVDLAFERSDWEPTEGGRAFLRNNGPLLAYIAGRPGRSTGKDHIFRPGEAVEKQIVVINDSRETAACACRWSLGLPEPLAGSEEVSVPTGELARVRLRFELPADLAPGAYELSATAEFATGQVQRDALTVHVIAPPPPVAPTGRVALFDPQGETAALLGEMGVEFEPVAADADLAPYGVLIVGKAALTLDGAAPDVSRVRDGLKVLVFEQTPEALEGRLGFRVAAYGLRGVFRRVPDHPLLAGIGEEHLRDWRGEATILPQRLDYRLDPRRGPTVDWCGIPVARAWRCGNRGNVASALIEKPARGDFLPVLDGGYSLQYSPLMEYREGEGLVLFCQMDVTGRTEADPAAETLVGNMLRYVEGWRPTPRRSVLYVGEPAGRAHLGAAGASLAAYGGGPLSPDQVLVVGPGGGRELAGSAGAVADWLADGGRLLAVGLDGHEANAFLPAAVRMQNREHIAAYFEPSAAGSPLAGVGPADVHNRAPREMPLLTGGALAAGNGVLGVSEDGSVAFCQIAPWDYDYAENYGLKRTFRRTAFLLNRLLANMGAAGSTPLLERFSSPPGGLGEPSLVRNGDFGSDTGGDGLADEWSVQAGAGGVTTSRERLPDGGSAQVISAPPAGGEERPSVMLAQHDVPVREGEWYRISLRARGTGLTADSVTWTVMNTADWHSFFEYQRFRPGPEWEEFSFKLRADGGAEAGTRFQIWHEGAGELSLADVRFEPIGDPTVGRWLEGLYLDEPVEWDDPYRFFRW